MIVTNRDPAKIMVKEDINKDYQIQEKLGKGQFGKVVLAISNASSERVAIKYIGKSKVKEDEQALFRELSILRLCKHPHIIRYIDCYQDVNKYMIVMELASYGELFDMVIACNGLPEEKAKKVFAQLLSAVEYCHGNMIAHQDIKLENILISDVKNLQVKLADFGFAGRVRLSLNQTWCGSPHYAAPEIIQHKRYNPIKADIWSLGVLLYALLTGKYPWPERNQELDMQKILNVDYIIPGNVPLEANKLIRKMIAKRRVRFSIDKIKAHRWIADDVLPSHLPARTPIRALDLILVEKIVSLGFDRTETLLALCENKNVQVTAIYHTLLDRYGGSNENDESRLRQHSRTNSELALIVPQKVQGSKKHSPATPRRKRKTKNIREVFDDIATL